MSPQHATRDGIADAGEVAEGDTVEDVVLWVSSPVDGVGAGTLGVEYRFQDESDACAMTVSCAPNQITPGDELGCDVTNDFVGDACVYRTTLTLTVTAFDDAICNDVVLVTEIAAEHAP